jgi:basic amino acid/polyamine antiporter, APA family
MENASDKEKLPTNLGMWDAVSIIIGIVVGAGIFETPPMVFKNLGGPWMMLGAWAIGGLLCFIGALCYAELATTYPQSGGDYVYLTRAYGRWLGFLFGWAQLAVILTANIGMMTFIFADYGVKLFRPAQAPGQMAETNDGWMWAGGAVVVLTFINILGIRAGKTTQNVLTVTKVLGLAGIVIAGLCWPTTASMEPTLPDLNGQAIPINIPFAMVLVFLTYGGWNDAAYVAAELRDGNRNIPRALLLGTGGIVLIYLLVNFAYLRGLGYDAASKSSAIAADVLDRPFGALGTKIMSLLVMISALGAANGLIFTGARVALKLGREHAIFGWLGHWNSRRGAPYVALITQAAISLVMIGMVGLPAGQELMNKLFAAVGLPHVEWAGQNGFSTLLRCTAPIFWLFFLLTGISLFVLRVKDASAFARRPFSVPLFPLTPIIFCATCSYMLYSGILYAGILGFVGAGLLGVGLPVFVISEWMEKTSPGSAPAPVEPGPGPLVDQPSDRIQPDKRSITQRRDNP